MNEANEVVSVDTPVTQTVETPVSSIAEGTPVRPEVAQTPVENEQLPQPPAEVPVIVTVATEAAAEPQKQQKRDNNRNKGPKNGKDRRPPMSDTDREAQWRERLLGTKIIKSELFIGTLCDYALKHRGYNEKKNWGSTLIRMHEHLVYRLLNRLETFTPADSEYVVKRLMQFLVDKPLGAGPIAWNSNYTSNFEQRKAIDKYYDLDCRMADIAAQDRVLLAFRDAAWPSKLEEEKDIGGSFAERYHYLVVAVVKFLTTDQELIDGMFEGCYHSAPTEAYGEFQRKQQERLEAKYGPRTPRTNTPGWITADGKCKECGSEVTTDESGKKICSNPLCDHNIAPVSEAMPSTFGQRPPRGGGDRPSFPPSAGKGGPRHDGRDRRHSRDDGDGEMQFGRKPKKHDKRFRTNDGDIEDGGHAEAPEHTTYSSPGSANFRNNAFDALGALG